MVHDNVEKIRKAKGVTKKHLAEKAGISNQAYWHISSGNVRLDVERLKPIAKALDVDPGIFFDDKLTDSVVSQFDVSA